MSAEEYSKSIEKYGSVKGTGMKTARPVNEKDREIFADYKKNKSTISRLARIHKMSTSQIQTSLVKVMSEHM